jgi:carboxylesterase
LARTSWRDWVASAEEAVAELRGVCTQVWSIGLSLGGLISLQLAERHLVDGVCAMAPAIYPPDRRMALARLLAPFMPYSRKDLADLHDPIALAAHADYELFPTRAVAELHAVMRHTRHRLQQITVPLLLIFARHDRVVALDALDIIWARVASTDKQQVILERGGHIVTEDYDKDSAFAAIDQFLQQHSQPVQRNT